MIRLRIQLGLNKSIRTIVLPTLDFFLITEDSIDILTEDGFNIFIT